MNAPVFEENAGKMFLQALLDNIFFGISIRDERAYSKGVHVSVSIFNVILSGAIIATSFILQDNVLSIIIPSIISIIIGIIYLILILIPKKREAGSLRNKLGLKDQFLNTVVQPNNSTGYKVMNSFLAMCPPIVFNVISYYTKLPRWPIVFVQMMNSPAFRQVNSSMAKYRPLDYFEPALTALIYTAGFSAISFGNVITACVLITATPFLLMFGILPQSLCLFYCIPGLICRFLQLPLAGWEAVIIAASITICYILAPVEALIIYFFICLSCCSFNKKWQVKTTFLMILAIVNVVVGAVLYHFGMSIGKIYYLINIVERNILFYVSIIVTGVFSTVYIIVTVLNDKKLHYTGKSLNGMIIYYYIQSLTALAIVCLQFVETVQIGIFRNPHLNIIFLMRSVGLTLFRPEAQHKGPFIGMLIELIYLNRPSLLFVSKIGLAGLYGSEIYLILRRMISYFQFTIHIYKYAVKDHQIGWQKKIYKFRVLLWLYNALIIIISSIIGFTVLPIAGMPVLQPFHHHPRIFFADSHSLRKAAGGAAHIDGSTGEALEKQEDLTLYNVTADRILQRTNKELRKLLMRAPQEPGDVLLLLHEKQLLFIEILGRNVFNSSVQGIVYALETQETTCHALERTKLEAHAQDPGRARRSKKIKSTTKQNKVEEGTNYTVPRTPANVDVSTVITFGTTPVTSGVVFETATTSQFIGRENYEKNDDFNSLVDDFEVPVQPNIPVPRSAALGGEQFPAPIRRRPGPITLGEGRITKPVRQILPPVRDPRTERTGTQVSTTQNHIKIKEEENFKPMWRFQGKINVSGLEQSEFSLTGIFTSQYIRDIVGSIYVKLLYAILLEIQLKQPDIFESATKSLKMIEVGDEGEVQKIQGILDEISAKTDVSQIIQKICLLQGYKLVFPQQEEEIAKLYNEPEAQIANKQLKIFVTEAFRTAAWATIQAVSMGDEVEVSDLKQTQDLLQSARNEVILITHGEISQLGLDSNKNSSGNDNKQYFSISEDMHGYRHTYQSIEWAVFRIPSGARAIAWSIVQTDVLFFKATDPERFSAQALPECCKNVLQEAAPSPFGYPLGYFGEAAI